MEKRYRVTLTEAERVGLEKLVSTGKAAAKKLVRARILLLANEAAGGSAFADPEIVAALGCGRATVERVRKQFVEEGPEATLSPKPSTRVRERRLDGKAEAHLIALTCSPAPAGRAKWTLRNQCCRSWECSRSCRRSGPCLTRRIRRGFCRARR